MKKHVTILPETTYEELVLIIKELESRNDLLTEYYQTNQEIKLRLQQEIEETTSQLLQANAGLKSANKELIFQNNEKEKRAIELGVANIELAFQNNEKEKRATELGVANIELAFQNDEKELRAAELNIANQDLTSLTFISSHDLQEPLRKIQTFINRILEKEENLSEEGKEYFEKITETAQRMRNLLEDLLAYSRIRGNERVFESTDITLLLDDVKNDFELIIKQKNAIIESINFHKIKVIPFQFRQLLHNLVSNSLKFSKPSEPPYIRMEINIVSADKVESIKNTAPNSYIHLKYTDNGIGFEPQFKDRIFEVFQRLHKKEDFAGTGMGLAICKKIIENHNGIITAAGNPGEGVQFDMYIPAQT